METKDKTKKQKDGKTEKLSKNVEKLVTEISKLSVMELSDLVNALQDKLGVTAAAPIAAAPVAAPGGEAPAEGGEGGGGAAKQTVVITAAGDNKISVIKAIREIDQNIGLKEAKDMTESLPTEVLKDAKADDAKEAAEKLKAAGATVELK
ncbi:MAG: 50S ribosomal protein L7/L12 [Patescibacteria group bacterium]